MITLDAPVGTRYRSDLRDGCRRVRLQARALRAQSLSLTGRGEQLVRQFASQAAAASAPHGPHSTPSASASPDLSRSPARQRRRRHDGEQHRPHVAPDS